MNSLKTILITFILLSASLAHAQTRLDDLKLNLPSEYDWTKGITGYESDSLSRLQTWAVEKYNGETVLLVRVISSIKTGMREGVDEVKKMVAQTDKVTLLGEGKIEGQYPYVLFKGPTEGSVLLMMYIETKTTLHIIKVVAEKPKISEDFVDRWSTILKNPEITPSQQ